ncbi:ATP-binding protein [Thiorhodococcus minor]|uniref:ATP-binding protein n=1 Tax=Thiorhodococcus minor TaxID=57489 RepID=A0A6M0K1N8_9GAMM|nr:ATP-binding protein [Thiorhodococcus minor]NEV63682.1 ATP-binding protein [Thiorhodococcus minor]
MARRKLPIGIQTFREIREEGYYYVDKTAFAWRLADSGKYYFLSRPRRFGKSLFLDTLAELFAGSEPLFRGLFVHERWDWSRRAPVIRLSFGGGVVGSSEDLREKIGEQLRINQEALGIGCTEPSTSGCFAELIRNAHARSGERAVVLVDEHDKPILDNLADPDVAREIRDGLRDLYSVIKDSDAHIRFAFLTGVSKFSKVSLFSGLNNLNDITVSPDDSAICGYTEDDLASVFAPELEGLDRRQIRHWYNGYNWTGESVYNPFDVLLLFDKRQFRPWWFETATPSFLIDVLTERQAWLPALGQWETDAALLSRFDVGQIATEALLFQTGYLTIDREELVGGTYFYRLRYPNQEVYQALNTALLDAWTPPQTGTAMQRRTLYQCLQSNDFSGLEALLQGLFASIPVDWYRNNPIAQYEGYYASVFYACFAALGLDLTPEETSNAGRLDLAMRFNGQIYLIEFKVVELTPEGRALEQIKERGYADKYRNSDQPVYLIGAEFSRERRSLVAFEVERLI